MTLFRGGGGGGGGGSGTITHVQSGGTSTPNSTTGSRAFGSNVTTGNKIFILAFRYADTSDDAFIAGDCAKSAGTATISAVSLVAEENVSYNGTQFINAGIWA